MAKKVIGITCDIKGKFFEIEKFYFQKILDAGGIPFALPMVTDKDHLKRIVNILDGIIISGSRDIDPSFYGQKKTHKINSLDIQRTLSEFAYLKEIFKLNKKKILGICGGMQLINVFLGGTLIQDILDDNPNCKDHLKLNSHKININNKTLLSSIFKAKSARVNTFHHQAVGKLGKNLIVSAIASDGVVEAIETPNKKMLAVQWHPELGLNKQNVSIFKWLTK